MKSQLLQFCLNRDLIPDEQFGFLPGRSTEWQLLSLTECFQEAMEKGHNSHALFLDVAKALDWVEHKLLLAKLSAVGLDSSAVKWIASYLSSRQICTRVEGYTSSLSAISSGVQQGLVLGPLLFLLYFRDLPSSVECDSAMFADDSLLFGTHCETAGSGLCCSVAENLDNIKEWSCAWNVKFNAPKSADMVISSRHWGQTPDSLIPKRSAH